MCALDLVVKLSFPVAIDGCPHQCHNRYKQQKPTKVFCGGFSKGSMFSIVVRYFSAFISHNINAVRNRRAIGNLGINVSVRIKRVSFGGL